MANKTKRDLAIEAGRVEKGVVLNLDVGKLEGWTPKDSQYGGVWFHVCFYKAGTIGEDANGKKFGLDEDGRFIAPYKTAITENADKNQGMSNVSFIKKLIHDKPKFEPYLKDLETFRTKFVKLLKSKNVTMQITSDIYLDAPSTNPKFKDDKPFVFAKSANITSIAFVKVPTEEEYVGVEQ